MSESFDQLVTILSATAERGISVEAQPFADCVEIKMGSMYEAPALSFAALAAVAELFGTNEITVDGYHSGGCETCDWGSNYGHEITVRNPTRNADMHGSSDNS